MAKDRLSGKLAVILHADIVGSTRMVQHDEHLAHERIQNTFREFTQTIKVHAGRVLESRGDALLAEFERPSDAITAALSFQSNHTEYLASIDDELKPELRIGIALGEVVIADDTITGTGVVMAQRVEQLAETGGLCITAAVRESLSGRLPIEIENLGQQNLKGFDEPVGVYKVERSKDAAIAPPGQQKVANQPQIPWLKIGGSAVVVLLILAGIFSWVNQEEALEETASIDRMSHPLPDKPSIAVLPFTNMSNDAEQDFFAYGMTDDLITDISKVSGLFVVSRNSVAKYKGKTVDIREVAEELGVRYVMEGSVRRVGNDVRINAQLIDAISGDHEWAERYDGSLDDVFSMQDQIIASIVNELEVVLIGEEKAGLAEIKTMNTDAYDAYLRGWERFRQGTPDDFVKAISFFEQATELDPDFALAHSALAAVDWSIAFNGWARAIGIYSFQARERSRRSLRKAMAKPSALTYQISSEWSNLFYRKPDRALDEAEQAITLNANDPAGHLAMAAALLKAERPNEAVMSVRTAMRLDPNYPAHYLNRLAQAQYQMGAYTEAAETLETSANHNPDNDWTFVYLVATYGQLGEVGKAKEALEKANTLRAKVGWGALTIEHAAERINSRATRYIFKWFGDLKFLRDGLRKAGVPNGNEWRNLVTREDSGGEVIDGAVSIDTETAKLLYDRGVPFIDIFHRWGEKRILGAHYLEMWAYDFNEVSLSKIVQKNQEVVIYTSNHGSGDRWLTSATGRAVAWGYKNIYYFKNGLRQWENAGYPVDVDYEEVEGL